MMAETVLLRVKRRGEQWLERPGVRGAAQWAVCFGGGLLLSSVRVWGRLQPVAMGLTAACTGWRCLGAAAGSSLGYLLFWGGDGLQGAAWAVGAMLLGLVLPLLPGGRATRFYLAAGCLGLVAGTAPVFGTAGAEVLALRLLIALCSVLLAVSALSRRNRLSRWLGCGVGVMALAGCNPWLGWLAAGFACAAAPLPAALAAALGAELGAKASISLTGTATLSFYLQRLLPPGQWRRFAATALACGGLMALGRSWQLPLLLFTGLGAMGGALMPWHLSAPPRRGSVGAAQVRLEQAARVFAAFQRQLLEYLPPALDIPALAQKLRRNACGSCSARAGCLEQQRMDEALLCGDEGFQCRRAELAGAELRRSREQLRRIRADRARQEQYRMALVQQYGFLADSLQALSDHLPEQNRYGMPRYRVQVSARSRGKELADGDRVSAFPGVGCRYYVLLCDGMGTGLGAAEESRRTAQLISAMLTAGMAPGAALGSVNSQLALMERGGAVSLDLAELRLDTGRIWLYKWGAGPSWLLRRKRAVQVGNSGPPPGLGVTVGRESVSRVVMFPGDTLVLLSDGVDTTNPRAWAALARSCDPGALAARILASSASNADDATAVVIRLLPHAPPTASERLG